MATPENVEPTDSEIERERGKAKAKKLKAHLAFVTPFSFHKSSTFMDYLHGDVKEGEAWIASLYEYSRESKIIRKAAERRNQLTKAGLNTHKAVDWALQELEKQPSNLIEIMAFLECESFPKKDWQELNQEDRNKLLQSHPTKKILPLQMTDVWILKSIGILDKFILMGDNAKPVIEDHDPQSGKFARPCKLVPPLLQQHKSFFQAIFALDFSESETRLVNRFREWLRLPENQERLAKYKRSTTGTTGKPLDRLKDLAAWRLYREHENNVSYANEFAAKHRKKFTREEILKRFKTKAERDKHPLGSNKPFRDAKGQCGNAATEAELFGEDADARKAQASAWKYMIEIMPEEFAPHSSHMLAMFVGIGKLKSKG